jgi:pseudaminic acid cytidylyltransferase
MKKRLLVIPARGGSQRIKRKNIKEFCGKPIISYSISAAQESNLFHTIHVSTEDDEIFDLAKFLGVHPKFKRDKYQSDNDYPLLELLKDLYHKFKEIGDDFNEIWMLLPCAPLIDASDLILASKEYEGLLNCEGLIAVSEYSAPIEWAFFLEESNKLTPVSEGDFLTPSQNLKKQYYDTGSFCIFSRNLLIDNHTVSIYSKLHGYILPREKSIDIDTIDDWSFAEKLFKIRDLD